eukprot:5128038-Pyramimonas_sp.AAC.1
MREEEVISNAANAEKGKMRLEAIITDPTPHTENSEKPDSHQVQSAFRPALEGPAKPSTAESGLPVGMKLTGSNGGNTLASYRPSSGDGPTGTTATKSSGEAGQGGEGGDESDAPNTEIVSSHEDDH